jgi:hypothetical protein
VDGALLGRAGEMTVGAVFMPVLPATDLMIMRLLAFTETACDFSGFLHVSRALREQVDWRRVAAETAESPYAFLTLLARLGVIEELGIRVDVRGDVVHLGGEVVSEERRREVEEAARAAAGGRDIRNELHVVAVAEPDGEERLS